MSNVDISFNKLLTLAELFSLYQAIGDTVRSRIDLSNLPYGREAMRNSLNLLASLGFIDDKKLVKVGNADIQGVVEFKDELYAHLRSHYGEALTGMLGSGLTYDDSQAMYRLSRNSVSLDMQGLVMLLGGIGAVRATSSEIYVVDHILLEGIAKPKQRAANKRKMTLIELKDGLLVKETLGEEAEVRAFAYEAELLKREGIDKLPTRISAIDVGAGYDLVSYLTYQSEKPDKFIEVKSCADYRLSFYISKNEVQVAKVKGDSYFLYLYDRKAESFTVIRNPYMNIFASNHWAATPQVFEVHAI